MRSLSVALLSLLTVAMSGCGGGGASSIPPAREGAASAGISETGATSIRRTASSTTSTSYPSLVTSANPIAYYRLNDTSSNMVDSGSHGLNGVYGANVKHGGGALTAASGAQSAVFPGSPAGADVPSNTGTVTTNALFATATTGLTVEAWVKPTALNGTNHFVPLVSYGREIQGQAWVIQVTPQSRVNFWMKTASQAFSATGSTTLAPATIYYVVATYDGAHASVYVNGKLESSVAATGSLNYSGLNPSWGLGIGGALGGSEPIFNGAIGDVAIYSTALSAATVQSHYLAGYIAPTPAPTPAPTVAPYTALVMAANPLAYYKLNDSGPSLTDSGPNQLNGTYGASVVHGSAALTSAGDKAAIFDGAAAGSDIPSNAATVLSNAMFTTPTTALTVEAWIKPTDYNRANSYVPIVAYGRQVIGSAWALQMTPQSALTFYLKIGAGSYLLKPATNLTPAQIYHVVTTYDGTTLKLYVNGALGSSVAATGAINYTGIRPQDGLAIGGALGGSLPVFNGAVNDVAIYPTALSAAAIQQHYLTGQIVAPVVETPTSSDGFVDSIGVVTHLRTSNSPYTNSFATFESLIKASGIRHIGDTLIATPAWYPQEVNQLGNDGIHASLIGSLGQTQQEITAAIPLFQNIEAVGGLNEPDDSGDSNWVQDTQNFQQMLWTAVKGNPATANLTVVGPSLISFADDQALGNLSGYMDAGSIHDYFNGLNPGTSGWGSLGQYGIYGSIAYNVNICGLVSGSKPVFATETGYGSAAAPVAGNVDSRTLARYVPRTYLEHFLHGIPRTTTYEFYDEPGTGNFSDFGLVSVDNTPKSSYYALKSLISTLADPGSAFTPKPLSYVLTGNLNNVHHLLLQKRDGTYELALWVEVQSYNPTSETDITVPAQTVTLAPTTRPTSASMVTIGDTGAATSSALTLNNGAATFSIDDHVTIVSFK